MGSDLCALAALGLGTWLDAFRFLQTAIGATIGLFGWPALLVYAAAALQLALLFAAVPLVFAFVLIKGITSSTRCNDKGA
jgi:hypothetical protein